MGLPIKHRIKNEKQFKYILDKGKKRVTEFFVVFYTKPTEKFEAPFPKFGFIASKKVGGAVDRNRAKRLIREAVRLEMKEMKNLVCIFILRKNILSVGVEDLQKELKKHKELFKTS